MRTLVIGDIHGQYKALKACLKASRFDYAHDRLIALGDVCDRGPDVRQCIDELLKISHLVYILGNHDAWALEWVLEGKASPDWLDQGGTETVLSYKHKVMPKAHIELLSGARLYVEEAGRLFVHGGFDVGRGVEGTPRDVVIWDRELLLSAERLHDRCPETKIGGYEEIFLGHTPDLLTYSVEPRHFCNVWALDTGAGYGRRLTIMDVETHQFWQAKC